MKLSTNVLIYVWLGLFEIRDKSFIITLSLLMTLKTNPPIKQSLIIFEIVRKIIII
jgi:hypothetical protein